MRQEGPGAQDLQDPGVTEVQQGPVESQASAAPLVLLGLMVPGVRLESRGREEGQVVWEPQEGPAQVGRLDQPGRMVREVPPEKLVDQARQAHLDPLAPVAQQVKPDLQDHRESLAQEDRLALPESVGRQVDLGVQVLMVLPAQVGQVDLLEHLERGDQLAVPDALVRLDLPVPQDPLDPEDLPDLQEVLVRTAGLEIQEGRDHRDRLAHLEKQDHLAHLAQLGHLAHQEKEDPLVLQEIGENQAQQESGDLLGLLDPQDLQGNLDLRVKQDHQDVLETEEHRDPQVL